MKNLYLVQTNYKGGFGKYSSFWFPYSVGSLWAYASQVPEISKNFKLNGFLFQRNAIDEVVAGMEEPSIVGFSNYVWNVNYNRALAMAVKAKWPETTIVFGGPEVPARPELFFETHPFVDIALHNEGEITFATILLEHLKERYDIDNVPGISYVHPREGVITNPSGGRILDLEALPSPYLTGVFDDLMTSNTSQWAATYETNRGCPFKCHFCDWGSLTFSKVKKFPNRRVIRELEWFGDHGIEYIFVADANFGAFKKRDYAIADHLVEVQERTGFPKSVNIQWAKNSNGDVVRLAKRLGLIQKGLTLSVQSMSSDVLSAIERQNMAIHNLSDILAACNKDGVPSYTELILGLPCETCESWRDNWHKLLDLGQHCSIEFWMAQLLENSALNGPEERSKYGIESIKARNYFFGISDSADKAETDVDEEIALVRATSTMPFEDLIEAYMYGWMMINFHLFGWTQVFARFMRKYAELPYGNFYRSLFDFVRNRDCGDIIHNQYRNTKMWITEYLTGGDIEINLKDEIGSDMKFVGHNLVYASQIILRFHDRQVADELASFLRGITRDLPPDLQAALFTVQEYCLLQHGVVYPRSFNVQWNIVDYLFANEELRPEDCEYIADYNPELRESVPGISEQILSEFMNMLWFKRRVGPGMLALSRAKKNTNVLRLAGHA